ncbi:hypothetical protein L3X38_021206 [Prunus dulcis]|uniref:Uncharacterized protein n=1 Tax=Prunus dulcis TaxID=3755 RepID=A0AAD4VTK3_PRUDU|nr:hypothetical protein L3X38_021206 [Prunus dulcis]
MMCQLNSISDFVFTETMISFCASVTSSPLFSSIEFSYSQFYDLALFKDLKAMNTEKRKTILACSKQSVPKPTRAKNAMRKTKKTGEARAPPFKEPKSKSKSPTSPEAQDHSFFTYQSETDSESKMGFDPNPCFEDFFVEWNLKAPLEVIYEENEGEEDEMDRNGNDPNSKPEQESQVQGLERYPSLSMYYPESDSDSSSDGGYSVTGVWDSPETMCFRWEEEDREGLIEIALEENSKRGMDFQVDHEEENLIEIDISPTRNNEYCGKKWLFSGEVRFS